MRRILTATTLIAAIVLIAAGCLHAAPAPSSQAIDPADPIVKTVQAYLAAVRTGDRDALTAIVVPEAVPLLEGVAGQQFIRKLQDSLPISSTLGKVETSASTATVTLSERLPETTHTTVVSLRKIGSDWKVDPR